MIDVADKNQEVKIVSTNKTGLNALYSTFSAIIIFFVAQVLGSLLVISVPLLRGWSIERTNKWLSDSTFGQFFFILAIEAVTVFLVILILNWRRVALKTIGLVKPKISDIFRGLAGFGFYFPFFIGIFSLAQVLLPNLNYDQKQQIGFENASGGHQLAVVFISLVILPPIAEEILCRGLLYTGLRKKFKLLSATIITSLLFAAAHLQFGSGAPLLWTAAMDTFILSLVLCYLRERSKSLWPGILLHSLKNSLAFVVLFAGK